MRSSIGFSLVISLYGFLGPLVEDLSLLVTILSILWSPSSVLTLTLAHADSSFSLNDWVSKPHPGILPRQVYHLLPWGGWSCLVAS